jgi:hypothetical protein
VIRAIVGERSIAIAKAKKGENACKYEPMRPKKAQIEITDATAIDPKPTGFIL